MCVSVCFCTCVCVMCAFFKKKNPILKIVVMCASCVCNVCMGVCKGISFKLTSDG